MSATDTHSAIGAARTTAVPTVDVTAAGATSADLPAAAPNLDQAGSAARGQSHRTEYEHLRRCSSSTARYPRITRTASGYATR